MPFIPWGVEEADTECAANDREPLLTFVVAGGGFAGVETIGSASSWSIPGSSFFPNLVKNLAATPVASSLSAEWKFIPTQR
jgi:hypothetical protein